MGYPEGFTWGDFKQDIHDLVKGVLDIEAYCVEVLPEDVKPEIIRRSVQTLERTLQESGKELPISPHNYDWAQYLSRPDLRDFLSTELLRIPGNDWDPDGVFREGVAYVIADECCVLFSRRLYEEYDSVNAHLCGQSSRLRGLLVERSEDSVEP